MARRAGQGGRVRPHESCQLHSPCAKKPLVNPYSKMLWLPSGTEAEHWEINWGKGTAPTLGLAPGLGFCCYLVGVICARAYRDPCAWWLWGCWKEQSPIHQEQQLSLSGTAAPWSPAGSIPAQGRGYPHIGMASSTCWRDALLMTSFISQTRVFYELQSQALPLWEAVKLTASII